MASVTTNDDGRNAKADDEREEEDVAADETLAAAEDKASAAEGAVASRAVPAAAPAGGRGFFTIYKKGQGYWTRMGTVIGAALVGAFTAEFIYSNAATWFIDATGKTRRPVVFSLVGLFLAVFAFVVFRVINRPKVVDFLIATDSEMRKVNWTTRRELIGSTKVVILFMLVVALTLFLFDVVFGYFFYAIKVLQVPPL